jgi:hypothetical protein
MTRDEFFTERLARYLAEGMAMEAARARASAVTASHFVESQMSDRDWYADSAENGIFG